MKKSDRYLKIVEWSEEDQCYVGTCPGLMIGGVHGKNEAQVYKQLCRVVNEWIKIHEKDGEPLPQTTANRDFSGKFMLRPGKALHKSIAIAALRRGESLNNYCIKALKSSLPEAIQKRKSPRLLELEGSMRSSYNYKTPRYKGISNLIATCAD